ncbi:MAG: cytochrome [Ramlibacter sp.]|nr:cytochrome [Ramlibacter sp.]
MPHPPPSLDIDPYATNVLLDPYAFHEALRKHPVVFLPAYDVYAIGRHAGAALAFTDHEQFSTTGGIGLGDARKPGPNARPLNPLLEVDPPQHTALRHAVNKVLSPTAVRQWRENMTRDARALVASLPAGAEVEAVESIVEEYVFKVFVDAVGIRFRKDAIKAIGNLNGNLTGPQNELLLQAVRRAAPYVSWFEESQQREHVVPGGIAEQFFVLEDAGELPAGTASTLTRTFVRGGMDSTIAGIGSTLCHLARNPAQWSSLRENPGRVRAAFEEGIRMETPFQVSYRLTTRPVVLDGMELDADKKVGIFMGSANRDPERWTNPAAYDITRATQGHLGFGVGAHNCIGQMIARLEAECLLAALLERFAGVELAGDAAWRPVNQVRTLERLPLRLRETRPA